MTTIGKPRVLLSGAAGPHVTCLAEMLQEMVDIRFQGINPLRGDTNPLGGGCAMADIVVLCLGLNWEQQLNSVMAVAPSARPAMVAIGPSADVSAVRQAMRAGARDFLTYPVAAADLASALTRIGQEFAATNTRTHGHTTVVINAKGGSGATLLASNLAYIMGKCCGLKTAVIDMDVQFGTLPLYLDVQINHSLIEALSGIDEMDALALEGYAVKHASGLYVLGALPDEIVLPGDIPTRALQKLLDIAGTTFDHIVIDLPRQIDGATMAILEHADHILIVMQQSVTHLRDAKRLHALLTHDLAIPATSIRLVVNRHHPDSLLSQDDIAQAFSGLERIVIPNDFKHVTTAINTGAPLYEISKNAAITIKLLKLAEQLSGAKIRKPHGLLGRALSGLIGSAR